MLRILLLEDSLLDTELIQVHLSAGGIDCELVRVEASADFQRALAQDSFDLILSDYSLPAFDGISALKIAQAIHPDVPFIFVSATLGEELAIETLKSGATDYVLKQRLERLAPSVKRALRETMERVKRQQAEMALRELAGELERRVVERTTELAKANESLREEIAERKRVEESLRRSESTIRSYFELPLIGIAITSPEKGWIEVNPKLCDILGYDRHELIQMTWVDVTYPDDLDADLEHFNRILAGEGDGYSMDKRFIRKDGRVIYASTSLRCVRKADASIDYFVTLVQDITERKQAEERLRLLESVAVNAKDAIVITEAEPICEPGPRIIYVNEAFMRMTGYSSEEVVGKTPRILRGPKTERAQLDKLRTALENWQPTVVELIDYRKDGSEFWVEISVVPIANTEGWYTHWVSIQRDITERKRAEAERAELIREQAARLEAEVQGRKSAFLAEASTALASSLDYETTLASVAQLAVPFIADWCAVDILEENQNIRRVAIAHGDPVKVELAWELERRYPRNFYATVGLPTVLRSGQSAIATEISDSALQAVAQDAEHLRILRELGLKSCIVVPMLARGRTLGAITLATAESGRRYSSDEVLLVEDVARRAALAVDNARLYRKKQEAQRIAEETAERTANLQALTAALSEALTPAQVGEVVVNRGLAALKASAGLIALLVDHDTLEVVRALGYPQEAIEDWSRFPLTTAAPIADAVRMQQPVFLESCEVWAQKYPHIATQYANTQYHAWAAIPLIVEGRTVGGIGFSFPTPQIFSEQDCAFMLAMGQQCAQALERARAYAAERQARADAEAANRMKDEFLATLSHELRTPLNAMLGWSQLLRTRKLEETKMTRALETIDRNTKSLSALIEDILDVSRIIRGKLQISVLPCDLVGVIEAAIETVRPAAEAKAIQIEYFCDSSIGLVLGDMNRLQQVVWNLLSNAVKFTPKGGHVEIRLNKVEGLAGSPGELHVDDGNQAFNSYAQIQVSDNGKGISPDFLPYVFERFRQENSSSNRTYGGLGLGLAIVRYLVEQHGGTVQALSEGEGKGATFIVQLPLSEVTNPLASSSADRFSKSTVVKHEAAQPVSAESSLSPPNDASYATNAVPGCSSVLNGLRVLIVDDEADARELLATILVQHGAQVTAGASAIEAFELLLQWKADVLVSDIGMPHVDGYALMRQIRRLAAERGGTIPAVALTAYARECDRIAALEAGFQVHLSKPFEPDELVQMVAKLAGLNQPEIPGQVR